MQGFCFVGHLSLSIVLLFPITKYLFGLNP